MTEAYSTANVADSAVGAATIIIEKIGEDAEDMTAAAEEIAEEAMVDAAIIIMATIAI